jgi:EpsI family protein
VGRTQAQLVVAATLAAAAVAGNALRATEPADPGALGLAGTALAGVAPAYIDEVLEPEFMDVLRAREVLYRTYEPDTDHPVWVFVGYFDRQREGSQVHSPRHCYPGAGWNIEQETRWPVPWGTGELRALIVHNGIERRIVCYWYQTSDRVLADEVGLKLALAGRAVRRRPQDVAFASISTRFASDVVEGQRRVEPYARTLHTEIERLFQERDESDPDPQ